MILDESMYECQVQNQEQLPEMSLHPHLSKVDLFGEDKFLWKKNHFWKTSSQQGMDFLILLTFQMIRWESLYVLPPPALSPLLTHRHLSPSCLPLTPGTTVSVGAGGPKAFSFLPTSLTRLSSSLTVAGHRVLLVKGI